MAREMKDSGVEWIGEIPETWELVKTKHCYTNHKDIVGNRSEEYERLALTLNGVIKRSKNDSMGLQPEAFNGYQILRENELVFKLIDLENVATSRVGYSPYLGIVSPAYIILQPNQIDESKYGEYYFLSMWQREIFNHMGDDGVRSSLNTSDLLNMPYLSLPAEEKIRIVTFLNTECTRIDSVIEKTRASIEEYKKLKQAVITQAVTKGIHPDRPMKDSGVEWIGEMPTDWELLPFRRVLNERNEKNAPVITTERLSLSIDLGVTLYAEKTTNLDRFKDDFEQYKIAHAGDLVMNSMNMIVGATGVSPYFGCVSPAYYTFYDNEEDHVTAKFCEYIFRSKTMLRVLYSLGKGIYAIVRGDDRVNTCRLKVSRDDLRSIRIPIPSISEQREIVSYLDQKSKEIDELIKKKEKAVEELDSYKKSLIYEYVTGKKEVPA